MISDHFAWMNERILFPPIPQNIAFHINVAFRRLFCFLRSYSYLSFKPAGQSKLSLKLSRLLLCFLKHAGMNPSALVMTLRFVKSVYLTYSDKASKRLKGTKTVPKKRWGCDYFVPLRETFKVGT